MSISGTVKSIQDIMRKDAGIDGDAQRIGQLAWTLFLKIFDDQEKNWSCCRKTTDPLSRRNSNGAANDRGPGFVVGKGF